MATELIPDDYAATLEELKRQVHAARLRVQRAANTELLRLWWNIGQTIRTLKSRPRGATRFSPGWLPICEPSSPR
ncbi:hypothetical protein [Microbacterium protaetiae]|uniref:hypothetical protein n=1 Tax=Microbacterium protaetiae TaxID=2509458 RepID=UPI001A914354|nr:hypothetical protein [Microbacterium protaetiae]